jgi:hypothetical protein
MARASRNIYHPDGDANVHQTVESTLDDLRANRVVGPASATNNGFALFDGTTGKLLKDAGYTQVPTAAIADDAVTYAKLQNVSATARILARITAAAGNVEEATLSQVLDLIGSAADGDILYRTGGVWARLAKGTDGHILTLASGVPTWAAPKVTTVAAGALSSQATLDIALSTADMYEIDLINIRPVSSSVALYARFSQSSSFLSGASDYGWGAQGGIAAANDEADSEIEFGNFAHGEQANEGGTYTIRILRPGASSFQKTMIWWGGGRTAAPASFGSNGYGTLLANTAAIDGIRFFFSSGNIQDGYYAARAYRFT